MAIRNIREYGDEILTKKAKEVEVIDEKIQTLIDDMLETMHKYNGVGLAAPQVGILKQIITIDITVEGGEEEIYVLINPKIEKTKGEQIVEEGCLSFPNQFAKIKRPKEIVVTALDRNGRKVKIIGKDLLAQALAHEIDHLNGQLYIDKIIPNTLEIITPEERNNVC